MSEKNSRFTLIHKLQRHLTTKSWRLLQKNRGKRKEYARNRYQNMTPEQKNKLDEYRREWFHRQSEDKKNEMKERGKENWKNRYHTITIVGE